MGYLTNEFIFSNIIGFIIAVTVSYLMHSIFTFKAPLAFNKFWGFLKAQSAIFFASFFVFAYLANDILTHQIVLIFNVLTVIANFLILSTFVFFKSKN